MYAGKKHNFVSYVFQNIWVSRTNSISSESDHFAVLAIFSIVHKDSVQDIKYETSCCEISMRY